MSEQHTTLGLDSVHAVLSAWTGIPVAHFQAGEDLDASLACLPEALKARIFGQDHAIEAAVTALRRALMLKQDPRSRRPRAVLLCVGPSGTGKTELARALAEEFYGDGARFLKRIDMSEFTAEHTVSRLVGAPPGYVGYGRGGELVEAIKEARHGVLLLDEVEKCHPTILTDALLPLVGDGIIHDMSTGELVDARNFLIVMTSNLDTNEHLDGGRPMGFGAAESDSRATVLRAVHAHLPGEFLGRIDEVIVFRPLSEAAVRLLWQREVSLLEQRLSAHHGRVVLHFAPLAERILLSQAATAARREGARAVRKVFVAAVERPGLDVLEGVANAGVALMVEVDSTPEGQLRFRCHE